MRFFRLKAKIRKFEVSAPKAVIEGAPVSTEAKAAINYKNLQKAALRRERRIVTIL